VRWGKRLKHSQFIDSIWEGLTDGFCGQVMGYTAENLVEEFKISREEQDQFRVLSHKRAFRAVREGKFKDEIVAMTIPKKMAGKTVTPELFSQAEGPNAPRTEQRLAAYPAAFQDGGTATPGNSCPLSDGARAALMMPADRARSLGYEPLGF